MPGPGGPWGEKLVQAVRDGLVGEELVNDKTARLLRLAPGVGALGAPGAPADDAPGSPVATANSAGARGSTARRPRLVEADLLRAVAADSFVLLRNQGGALPLKLPGLRRVALIGPNALYPVVQGGGSAGVMPASVSSPVDGLRAALRGKAELVTAVGCRTWHPLPELPAPSASRPGNRGGRRPS